MHIIVSGTVVKMDRGRDHGRVFIAKRAFSPALPDQLDEPFILRRNQADIYGNRPPDRIRLPDVVNYFLKLFCLAFDGFDCLRNIVNTELKLGIFFYG